MIPSPRLGVEAWMQSHLDERRTLTLHLQPTPIVGDAMRDRLLGPLDRERLDTEVEAAVACGKRPGEARS